MQTKTSVSDRDIREVMLEVIHVLTHDDCHLSLLRERLEKMLAARTGRDKPCEEWQCIVNWQMKDWGDSDIERFNDRMVFHPAA